LVATTLESPSSPTAVQSLAQLRKDPLIVRCGLPFVPSQNALRCR
jgi:hypothetical protein